MAISVRWILLVGLAPIAAAAVFLCGELPGQERRVNAIWSYQNAREILVVWNPNGCDEASATCVATGLKVLETNRAGGYLVCKCPGDLNVPEAVKQLAGHKVIAHVEPNATIRIRHPKRQPGGAKKSVVIPSYGARRVPNDPMFARLWGMDSIRAPQAWQCVRSSPVIVAVIDSGVDYRHEDLKDNMWRNPGEIAGDGKDNDGNGVVDDLHGFDALTGSGDPMDEHGHGTHCAGIIGAVGSTGTGVSGVNWSVKIMAVKVFDAHGVTNLNAMIKGIDYAWKNGARVANASFGGSRSKLQRDAIARAEAAGMIFVAAAGNESESNDKTPLYPASFGDPGDPDGALGNVISVGSLTSTGKMSAFSNYGKTSVHLVAPGGSDVDSDDIFSTVPLKNSGGFGEAKYGYTSGTSTAAPHVAGAVALVWGHPSYQYAGAKEVKELILTRTRRLSELTGKCSTGGTLDLSFLCVSAGRPPFQREPFPMLLPRPILPRR